MANFNYKKYLTENKLTQTTKLRAGILAEGQFSWMTQDTNQQIGSQEENTIPVYMYDNEGNSYYESNYDGYGEFGGVDYYELLDKMNGGDGDRSRGINLAFEKIKTDSEILYPALVTKPNFNFKSHDFTQQPKNDPNQSWYMEPEEEDYNGEDDYDYSNDYDDNEGDGYIDDTDSEYDTGVDEGKKDDKKSNKMKRSELKEKIKEMALAEMKMKEDTYAPTSETDFLSEIEDMLNGDEDDDDYDYDDYDLDIEFKKAPNEASYNDVLDIMKSYEDESVLNDFKAEFSEGEPVNKKDYSDFAITLIDDMSEVSFIQANWISMFDEEVYDKAGLTEAEEEVDDTEVAADGEENIDVDTTTEVDPNVKAVQDALTQAQAAAQKLGDPKLTDQIGNTITFFTRAHVVEKGAVAEEKTSNITEDITNDIEAKIKSGEIDAKEVEAAAKKAMSGDSTDLALMMAGFGKMFETKKEDKKSSMVKTKDLNENTSLSPVNLTKQNFDKIENSPLSKEYDEMFSILDNLISKYPEFKKKDIYDYFKLLAIDKYFNSGYLDRMWRKNDVAEGDLMKNIGKGLEYEATEEMIRDYAQHLMDEGSYDVEELAQSYLDIPRSFPKQLDYTFFKNNYDDILSVAMTGLDEGKTKDLNEAMFPMLKKILK
jgi:hypothetical protein